MYVRDPAFVIGNRIFFGNLYSPERRKEVRGFNNFTENIKPQNIISIQNSLDFKDAFIEGGDVIVDYPYVFVGISNMATNIKGANWLQAQLGNEYKVIPLEFADNTILHLDCIMTIIGKQKGIIHKNSLKLPLPFPLNEYDFIEVDSKIRKQLGTNVFVVDEKTVIVQKKHKKLQLDLTNKGFNVETVDFDWHSDLGGAFRCVTFPVERAE
jgi:glycine amidinotransferase